MEVVLRERKLETYDASLRDGGQDERAEFTVGQKIAMARQLDRYGFDYIEGGWPGANATDTEFFEEARDGGLLKHSKLVAFGMTHRVGMRPEDDPGLVALLKAGTDTITIFGKTWDEHVIHSLKTTLIANVDAIHDSVDFLRTAGRGRDIFYDAEHFFDGFAKDPEYAIETLIAAKTAGALRLILCDTNGGSTPEFVENAVRTVVQRLGTDIPLGIHVHNDGGESISSTIRAVQAGVTQVQGCVNGIGERTGNVDLCVVMPRLYFAYGYSSGLDLTKNAEMSDSFEISSGILASPNRPFGPQMASHKGGVHNQAVYILPPLYENIEPALVGRERRMVASDQGGGSNIVAIAEKYGYTIDKKDSRIPDAVAEMKAYKVLGDAQEFLLVYRRFGDGKEPFEVSHATMITSLDGNAQVSIDVDVNGTKTITEERSDDGALNAFDIALRSVLEKVYPSLTDIKLTDYSVKLPNREMDTSALVQVMIEFGQNGHRWKSIARHHDEQQANVRALMDGYKFYLDGALLAR